MLFIVGAPRSHREDFTSCHGSFKRASPQMRGPTRLDRVVEPAKGGHVSRYKILLTGSRPDPSQAVVSARAGRLGGAASSRFNITIMEDC
jgi:hypothetical protein